MQKATDGGRGANKEAAAEAANRRVSQTSSRTRNMASASRATSGSSSVLMVGPNFRVGKKNWMWQFR